MKKLILAVAVPFAIVGCSSVKYNTGLEVTAPSFAKKPAQEGDVVAYPSWYADTKSDDDKLYAVGSEFSKDFQFSVDNAMLSAKRELASQYSSYVSAMMKNFSQQIGESGDVVREIDQTTRLLVAQVNMIGVKREGFEVRHERNGYRSFVKLSYTTSEANKLLVEAVKQNRQLNAKANASKAFKELEESVADAAKRNTQ
jgi:hypothetical protein